MANGRWSAGCGRGWVGKFEALMVEVAECFSTLGSVRVWVLLDGELVCFVVFCLCFFGGDWKWLSDVGCWQ